MRKIIILIFGFILFSCKDTATTNNKLTQNSEKESFENKLPYSYKEVEQYYKYDSITDSYLIKPNIKLKEHLFSQKEKETIIKENEFEYKINAKTYYEVCNFKLSNNTCKLIIYNNTGENDSQILQIQLNSYDSKGEIIDALLLDQRFTFETEYYREFTINKDFSVYIKKYSVDNLLFDDEGNIVGERKVPKINTMKLTYGIANNGKFIQKNIQNNFNNPIEIQKIIPSNEYTLKKETSNYFSLKIEGNSTLFSEVGDGGKYYAEYKLYNTGKGTDKIILQLADTADIPPILKGIKTFATISKENNSIWIESEYLEKMYNLIGKQELQKTK